MRAHAFWKGVRDAVPLLGGYIPVGMSFGLIAVQAGFNVWIAVVMSLVIYAGASQFLFVAMLTSGAPLWLVIVMTLLINARHVVYGPNIAPWLTSSRWWPWMMHGLTDQIFALAHVRLPQMPEQERLGWFAGAALLAWISWIAGTAFGGIAGAELTQRWPMLESVLPFALPAMFLVLLTPRFTSRLWAVTLITTMLVAAILALAGIKNSAIPLGALCGALLFYVLKSTTRFEEVKYG
ncbi:Inner membrane protein YgaZ [Thalassocella blandensis]|nr:Inner membrane protein YgaZ [Thalassocella blandensis]